MERKTISFSAKIKPIEKLNDEFLKCKIYVCALGKNRNFSHISRDAAEEAEYSLYNIPVIGHLYEDENGELHMGGHDMTISQDKDGNYVFKSLCVPYGVVPQQDNVHYEDIKEPNGDIKTYIVADCILWVGRFPELMDAAYAEDWLFNQSMEINVNAYKPLDEDKNYTDILNYTYSALCLLGRSDDKEYNVEPCFPESHVSVSYEFENDQSFAKLMEEFKKDLSECFSAKNHGKEEEEFMTDEDRSTISEETEELAEETTVDTVEEAELVEGEFSDSEPQEGVEVLDATDDEPDARTFTYREIAQALSEAMPNSDNVYYYVCDFDEKYVYVNRCSFDSDGNYSEEQGRFEYTYDESEKTAIVAGEFEEMFVRWLTKAESDQIDLLRGKYEELKAYKEEQERKAKENAIDAALEPFAEDLAGNAEFEAVVAKKYSFDTVEDLQNACYIIRGKYGLLAKAHKNNEPSVPVGAPKEPQSLREKFHETYGRR